MKSRIPLALVVRINAGKVCLKPCTVVLRIPPLHNWRPIFGQLSSRGENYEFRCSLVICCAFNTELSSDEKCAIERDRVVKIVEEAGEALSFVDGSKIYVEKYESDLKQLFWKGLKPSIKDKVRHKKDECKTFGELLSVARYGEREIDLSPVPARVVKSQ